MSDDTLSPWDIGPNAPRIVHEAVTYWDAFLPCDFNPVFELSALLPWVMLVDVLRDQPDFRYRLIGTGIASKSRRDHMGYLFSELSRVGPDSMVWKDRIAGVEPCKPRLTAPAYIGRN
jgi:hypothetical protein